MGVLRTIKIRSTTFFRCEVKQSAPCHNILRHVKEAYEYTKRYFIRKIQNFLHHIPPASLLDDLLVRTAGQLWWTNREFSSANIPQWFYMLIIT
jgi:hypothetical protein